MAATATENLNDLTVDELRDIASEEEINLHGATTKGDIIKAINKGRKPDPGGTTDEGPPQPVEPPLNFTSGPPAPIIKEEDWEPPDLTKPILNLLNPNGNAVTVMVLDAKTPTGDPTNLVFVQYDASRESLTVPEANRKFASDYTGQIWYGQHGISPTDRLKPLDIGATMIEPS